MQERIGITLIAGPTVHAQTQTGVVGWLGTLFKRFTPISSKAAKGDSERRRGEREIKEKCSGLLRGLVWHVLELRRRYFTFFSAFVFFSSCFRAFVSFSSFRSVPGSIVTRSSTVTIHSRPLDSLPSLHQHHHLPPSPPPTSSRAPYCLLLTSFTLIVFCLSSRSSLLIHSSRKNQQAPIFARILRR